MPLSSLASYISTMQEFITHWTAVNVDLGAGGPLVLNGPYAVADLTASRTALQTKITAVQAAENSAQQWANERDNRKAPLLARVRQFRAMVQGLLPNSPFVQGLLHNSPFLQALPLLPSFKDSPGDLLKALDDMASLWSNINTSPPDGFIGPLKLQGGYLLATFNADLTVFRAALTSLDGAMQTALIAREVRNQLLPPIKNHLVLYRQAVMGYYAKGHAMIERMAWKRAEKQKKPQG